MPKQTSIIQRLFECLCDHLDNDSTFRFALAMAAVTIYCGICLSVFYWTPGGDLDFECASALIRT